MASINTKPWATCVGGYLSHVDGREAVCARKGQRTDCAAGVTNGCSLRQRCCYCGCCVCRTRQEWSITPPPQTLVPHRLGLMAVWQEKGTRRRLAAVKNSGGGSFCFLKGGRAKALPFQFLKNVFSALAEGNVTHLVAWQRNVSSRRLDGADRSFVARVTAAQKYEKPDNQEAWMMFNQPNINQGVYIWVHSRLWIKKKTYFTWGFILDWLERYFVFRAKWVERTEKHLQSEKLQCLMYW